MSSLRPESVSTSSDNRSKRPLKKRALTPVSSQAASVDALFARPDQDIRIPTSSTSSQRPRLAVPPEIVTNVQGSSAGAGSGEFHVYKASRRREYERLRVMDEELKVEQATEVFEKNKQERDSRDDEKTRKNREKREKKKQARERAKKAAGSVTSAAAAVDGAGTGIGAANHAANGDSGMKDKADQVNIIRGGTKPRLVNNDNNRDVAHKPRSRVASDTSATPIQPEGLLVIHDDED